MRTTNTLGYNITESKPQHQVRYKLRQVVLSPNSVVVINSVSPMSISWDAVLRASQSFLQL